MHNLPIFLVIVGSLLLATRLKYGRIRSTLLAKIRFALNPIEDQWTLQTLDGDTFEEVEIESVKDGYVVFKHRVGKDKLPIALLTEDSQHKLHEGYKPSSEASIESKEAAPTPPDDEKERKQKKVSGSVIHRLQ